MAAERDHLLDAAGAVGEADRGREQSGPEHDPLLVRVGARDVGDLVQRLPDGGGALRAVPARAEARVERALELLAVDRAQRLVHVPEPAVGEPAGGPGVTPDQRLEALDTDDRV